MWVCVGVVTKSCTVCIINISSLTIFKISKISKNAKKYKNFENSQNAIFFKSIQHFQQIHIFSQTLKKSITIFFLPKIKNVNKFKISNFKNININN